VSRVVLADSGPLYAIIDRSDEHHQQAKQEFASITNADLSLTLIVPVVQETHRLLLQRIGLHVASPWLHEINSTTAIVTTNLDDYWQACARLSQYPDQRISIGDGLLAAVSQRLQSPVWTYDHHFDTLGATRWYPGT
jgi:predicted nucleic acid-binding protein